MEDFSLKNSNNSRKFLSTKFIKFIFERLLNMNKLFKIQVTDPKGRNNNRLIESICNNISGFNINRLVECDRAYEKTNLFGFLNWLKK